MRRGFLGLFLLSTVLAGYAEAAESRLEQISKTKTIKIAHRTDAAPFSFVKNSEVAGYTIDICKFVAQSLERRLNIQGLKTEWVPRHHADTL
jgi:glutamate/aspartate transport system substrate-binding protein